MVRARAIYAQDASGVVDGENLVSLVGQALDCRALLEALSTSGRVLDKLVARPDWTAAELRGRLRKIWLLPTRMKRLAAQAQEFSGFMCT
jgi:hypothetical protein